MGSGSRGIINLKFLAPVSFAILIVGLLGSAGQAQASVPSVDVFWDGGGPTDNWSDPLNWSDNVLPTTSDTIIIDPFPGTDVTVHLDIDFGPGSFTLNIGEGDTLIIDSTFTLTHGSFFNNFNIFTINNDGTIVVDGVLDNRGTLNNNGIIINNGDIDNDFFSSILNNNGVINNNADIYVGGGGTFNNFGTLNNNIDGFIGIGDEVNGFIIIVNGESSLNNSGVINNDGVIRNDVLINNFADGIINNNDGGIIQNFSPRTLRNFGTINNFGTIENFGLFFNSSGGTINNFGSIVNLGTIDNEGTINNFCGSSFINEGTILDDSSGTINGVNLITGAPVFVRATTTTISCGEGPLFGVVREFTLPSNLYSIDPNTGAAILIGSIGFKSCSGIAIHPNTGEMFGACNTSEGRGKKVSVLVSIDTLIGAGTLIGQTGIENDPISANDISDLSFRPDGTLFGYAPSNGPFDLLVTIDTNTGAATLIGPTEFFLFGNGIAWSPADILFHADDTDLSTVNPTDGTLTFVASLTFPDDTDRISGMDFQPVTNILYGSAGLDRSPGPNLVTIDTSSGVVKIVGNTGLDGLTGLAFDPFAEPEPSPSRGGGDHEHPTIGKNSAGIQIVNSKGICIDAQCWTVTEFDTDFKLLQLLTSRHTITNTIFCNEGVQECDSVGVAFMTSTDQFGDLVMMVEAQKTGGEWVISWYDPQDFIHDPDDYLVGDPRGAITFTVQIVDGTGILSQDGNFLLTSFTIDFKNKDTGALVIRIQVGDEEYGQSTFWFNEGVEFIDSDAYPSIETAFEESLEVDSLCLNEDPTYRYSCAFAENRDRTIQNAEETLWQMLNGEYIYK